VLYCDVDSFDGTSLDSYNHRGFHFLEPPKHNTREGAKYDAHPTALDHGLEECNGYFFVHRSYYETDWHDFFGCDITFRPERLEPSYFQFYGEDPLYNESCRRILAKELDNINKMKKEKSRYD
jgi:hypothetical protein